MPTYTYRREDGTTFDIRQSFSDDPLTVDPETGQQVVRIVQAPGIIFKGSGFYVTDTGKANNPANPKNGNGNSEVSANGSDAKADSSDSTSETKSEATASTEKKPAKSDD